VKQSHTLTRPETTIAGRSDKAHLWEVNVKDNLVKEAKKKISKILQDNLEVVELSIKVYDKYQFILKEKERIQTILAKEQYDRTEFQNVIDMYYNTINEIREEMPFEIRMNMFLIKCGDINNKLCEECEEIIKIVLDKIGDHVFNKQAFDISQQVKQITEDLS